MGDYLTPVNNNDSNDVNLTVCDPENDGMFPLLGNEVCVSLGAGCSDTDWASIPDSNNVNIVYVSNAIVNQNADGTRERPFNTVNDALIHANPGSYINIGSGTYNEVVQIDKDINIYGNCAHNTIIDAPGPHGGVDAGAIFINSDVKVVIKNLRISGEQNGIYINSENAEVIVDGVWINKATRYGVLNIKGKLIVNKSLIDSTKPQANGRRGRGFGMFFGPCDTTITNSLIENNYENGVTASWANEGYGPVGILRIENVAVRNTMPSLNVGIMGRGLEAVNGAEVWVKSSLFEDSGDIGIAIDGKTTVVNMEDVVVRNTKGGSDGTGGIGINVRDGPTLRIKRGLIISNKSVGLAAIGGLWQSDASVNLNLEDVVVKNTEPQFSDKMYGFGIQIQKDVHFIGNRLFIEENRNTGFAFQDVTKDVKLEDIIVRNTFSRESDDKYGNGILIENSSNFSLERGVFENNLDAGVIIDGNKSSVVFKDLIVRNTRSQKSDLKRGRGIAVQSGANLVFYNSVIENNKEVGLVLIDNAKAELNNIVISKTDKNECANLPEDSELNCKLSCFGFGLGIVTNSKVEFNKLLIDHSAFVGLQVADQSTIKGQDLEITENNIGVSLYDLSDDFDFGLSVNGLIMKENKVNFYSKTLELPEMIEIDF